MFVLDVYLNDVGVPAWNLLG